MQYQFRLQSVQKRVLFHVTAIALLKQDRDVVVS